MEEAGRKAAAERVRRLRAFYTHLFTYLVINGFLVAVNLLASPGTLWFYWVSLAWGIGLLFDAFETFLRPRFWGREWEERKIEEYMRKHPGGAEGTEESSPRNEEEEQRKSA